jgi:hypothetical protein
MDHKRSLRRQAALLGWLTLGVALATLACGEGPIGEERGLAVIYGSDDREEVYRLDEPTLASLARHTLVALTDERAVTVRGNEVELRAASLQQRWRLCPGERYADQPTVAACAGVLLSDDLMLTAGHCVDHLSCDGMRILRGYHYAAEGQLNALRADDVFRCRAVLAREVDPPGAVRQRDYAWIRLDRPVTGRWPVGIAPLTGEPADGDTLVALGFPAGVPAKVTRGRVFQAPSASQDFFVASLDTFHGDSGGPVFDRDLRLLGLVGRGKADFVPSAEGCYRTNVQSEDRSTAEEEVSRLRIAVDALCTASASEPGLCGDPALDRVGGCDIGGSDTRGRPSSLGLMLVACALGAWRLRPRRSRCVSRHHSLSLGARLVRQSPAEGPEGHFGAS